MVDKAGRGCLEAAFGVTALSQELLAHNWLEAMPEAAVDVVRNNRLKPGADLVRVAYEYGRPSCKETG